MHLVFDWFFHLDETHILFRVPIEKALNQQINSISIFSLNANRVPYLSVVFFPNEWRKQEEETNNYVGNNREQSMCVPNTVHSIGNCDILKTE